MGTGESVNYTPNGTGDRNLKLNIITDGGCSFSYSEPIIVNPTPMADFEVSTVYGGAPLQVWVEDFSSGASDISWLKGGTPVQWEINNPLIFDETGTQIFHQVAKSAEGCIDSAYLEIEVVASVLDLVLQKIRYVNDGGNITFVADILNEGSAQVEEMDVLIEIENDITLRENISEFLDSGEKITRVISSSLENEPDYVCFTILPSNGGAEDQNLENNKLCVNFAGESFFLRPYPNPAIDKIVIPALIDKNEEATIELINIKGMVVFSTTISRGDEIFTNYEMDVTTYPPGYYIIKVITNSGPISTPVIIKR